jgi:DNA topoisomerase II
LSATSTSTSASTAPLRFELQTVHIVPALYKIIDEALGNVRDQWVKLNDPANQTKVPYKVRNVVISLNQETGWFTVRNDGMGIDISFLEEMQLYTVEMIFGHLLSSTNYDHTADKLTGGKNGYGIKLANIFSKQFIVETVDSGRRKRYVQRFEDNMKCIHPPVITSSSSQPYTHISFLPDFERFGLQGWTSDMIRLIQRRAIELASCMSVSVTFNGWKTPISNLGQFMDLFIDPSVPRVFECINEHWTVGVALNDGFQHYSFVNGIATHKGGKHVEFVTKKLIKCVQDELKKRKNKGVVIPNKLIQDSMFVFINCQIVNPAFDSQTKENLITPCTKFKTTFEFSSQFMKQFLKLGIEESVIRLHEFKETKRHQQKVDDGGGNRVYIPKLTEVIYLYDPRSTIIFTEGDSASATARSGLSEVGGMDFYGVFPLKGKMINPREKCMTHAGKAQFAKNEEITNIMKICGLNFSTHYTSLSELRYNHAMIMADTDEDGFHIKGLFMNFINMFWPELIELGFVESMLTPIVKTNKGNVFLNFYSIPSYLSWLW